MVYFISLLTSTQDLNKMVSILSIAVVTLLILLGLNIWKAYKLNAKLKSLDKNK